MNKFVSTLSIAAIVVAVAASGQTAPTPATDGSTPAAAPPAATAVTAPTASGEAASTTQSDANKTVCKKQPPPLGSRLGARTICMTQAEWDQMRTDSQRELTRMQGRASAPGPGAGGN